VSDLYIAKVSEENQCALGIGARGGIGWVKVVRF